MYTEDCITAFTSIDDDKNRNDLISNITLSFLLNNKFINVHTCNVCMYKNLSNLYDIIMYFKKMNTFLDLKNIGRKSNELLIDLCTNKVDAIINIYVLLNDSTKDQKQFEKPKLNEVLKNITLKFLFNKNFINAHTYNACINNNFSCLYDIVAIYCKNNTFNNIPNIGKKSNDLLISLCENDIEIIIRTYNAFNSNSYLPLNREDNNVNNIDDSKSELDDNINFALDRYLFFYKNISDDEFIDNIARNIGIYQC